MTMSEAVSAALPILAGAAVGVIFFGGLWWTVRHSLSMRQPALLFLLSMTARTAVVLAAFYLVADGQWQRLLLCLAGFGATRLVAVRILPTAVPVRTDGPLEGRAHAP